MSKAVVLALFALVPLAGCLNRPPSEATPKPTPQAFPLPVGDQTRLEVGDSVCILDGDWFTAELEVLEVSPQAH